MSAATARPGLRPGLVPYALLLPAALWLVVAPFALGHADSGAVPLWHDLAAALATGLLALGGLRSTRPSRWRGAAAAVLGLWLVLTPLLPDYAVTAPRAADSALVTGVIVVVLGIAAALRHRVPARAAS